ncbi:response regulator [Frigoriglobus tundricola]|uniref:Response regulatory domain-containing protein n=1 Tax=Frigoriglobus tundricola TaxID=2774151 RepID=A0A6M5YQD3_9BACT|nr:response regulator [Frigoriglobus tundricola]QJW95182.1 hypothetical protein FTUN_2721 [Frigoriglobus tundricola]
MAVERLHILVVDDIDDVADSTAELLVLWGYDATACYSGAAGLGRVRVRRPAAVVLDLAMPRMDGVVFARALHRVPGCAAVPLIALSGYATPEYALRARRAGIGHYLLKAAAPEQLKALLARVTRARAPVARRPADRRGGCGDRSRRSVILCGPVVAPRFKRPSAVPLD